MATRITFGVADQVPLTFEDLWYALDVTKRACLLEYMARGEGVGAVMLGCSLSHLDHQDGTLLISLLVECSMFQFSLYVKICSIDRSSAFEDQLFGKDAITIGTFGSLPEWKEEIKASVDQYWNAISSDTPTNDALEKLEHSPEDLVEEAASLSLKVFEPADPKTRQLIHNLPSELLLLIQDEFFHLVFSPRHIYPHNEHLNVDVFEALDHQLLAKYQHIFFCDNIWVIGQGDRNDGVGFLDRMPILLKKLIRKVEMSFTTHDHCHSSLDFYFAEDAQDTRNALEILQSYRQECAGVACKLTTTWWQKFYEVSFLRLDYCILDFTEAYAPDGEYLGVQVARELIQFCHGLPAEFFIYAPTQDLADEIWDVLLWNNP